MPWFAPELEPLLAVAAAMLDQNGTLIEANAGFLRLIEIEGRQPIGALATRFFVQPNFAALTCAPADSAGELYRGLLTIGVYLGHTRTLCGRVWRFEAHLRVLAEYDIEEFERLNELVLKLNLDSSDAQLRLTQANLQLRQREAEIVVDSLTDPLTGVGNGGAWTRRSPSKSAARSARMRVFAFLWQTSTTSSCERHLWARGWGSDTRRLWRTVAATNAGDRYRGSVRRRGVRRTAAKYGYRARSCHRRTDRGWRWRPPASSRC